MGRCQPLGGHPPVAAEILGVKLRNDRPLRQQVPFMNVAQPFARRLHPVEALHGPRNPKRKLDFLEFLHHPRIPESGRDDLLTQIHHSNCDGKCLPHPAPPRPGHRSEQPPPRERQNRDRDEPYQTMCQFSTLCQPKPKKKSRLSRFQSVGIHR
ncbi:MAG: hypothetical protein ABSE84_27300, partial [Isosphaeraceae bacterium]